MYITEHGAASDNEEFRIRDLQRHLQVLHGAIQEGVDVRGFFYWSLMDNFEWQFGYTKKFGLLSVDFRDAALPRSPKPLAEVYTRIARDNGLLSGTGLNYGRSDAISSATLMATASARSTHS
jgi:beta-glucosidase